MSKYSAPFVAWLAKITGNPWLKSMADKLDRKNVKNSIDTEVIHPTNNGPGKKKI